MARHDDTCSAAATSGSLKSPQTSERTLRGTEALTDPDRWIIERQVTSSGTSEPLVPRLRGVSHAVASLLAVAAAVVLIVLSPSGDATVAAVVYGAGLVALFGGSALYHRWPGPQHFKQVLQRIDHSTIFVFIAASYTPIALIVLHGTLAWVLLGVAWFGAAAGVTFSLGWIQAPRAVIAAAAAHYVAVVGWVLLAAAR